MRFRGKSYRPPLDDERTRQEVQALIANPTMAKFTLLFAAASLIHFTLAAQVCFHSVNATTKRPLADDDDPDENRDAVEIIESRGYIAKTYYVTTPDGYVLALHRIINPLLVDDGNYNLKPVMLQHGLVASSTDFIINAPSDFLHDPMASE